MRLTLLSTPPTPLEACPHERRPGTTVCLHCRHTALVAARERLNHVLLRAGAVTGVIATFIAVGAFTATALRGRGGEDSNGSVSQAEAAPSSAGSPARTSTAGTRSTVRPVLPAGQTALVDGITAIRGDSAVTVAFDTPLARTRRPEKFERLVRTTLPMVYGPAVSGALARLPEGSLAAQGELLTELPVRGLSIPVDSASTIRLFPETRPGQDGPLVIRYRVFVAPAHR